MTDERGTGRAGSRVDVEAVAARYAAALADVPVLLAEVRGLRAALGAARLRAANLEAAGRAVLGAVRDGEHDPLFYLRDELGVTR